MIGLSKEENGEGLIMKRTKLLIIVLVVAMAVVAAGVVGAQDAPPTAQPARPGALFQRDRVRPGQTGAAFDAIQALLNAISSETGLAPREVIQQVMQGSTLADVIATHGGDTQVIIDAVITPVTERLDNAVANGGLTQDRADEILANVQAAIERALNGELNLRERGQFDFGSGQARRQGERVLADAVSDATGLTGREILVQLREGTTLAELVDTSGGDIDAVMAAASATLNERIDQALANGRITAEQADNLRANIDSGLTELMNGDIWAREAGVLTTAAIVHHALEETGLTPLELRVQLHGGATLAQVLETNGVAVDGFIADIMARVDARLNVIAVDGRMTQARVDELMVLFHSKLTEWINQAQAIGI